MGAHTVAAAIMLLSTTTPAIPIHHQLSVRLDPPSASIDATDHIRLRSPRLASFALARGLRVESLTVDGQATAVASDAGHWNLDITGSETHDITIQYRGVLPSDRDDGGPVIDAAGTFLTGDGWYPTFDADALSYELTVSVPAEQLAVAPGKLMSETTTAQLYTARYESEGPMDEIALFAGPYHMSERRDGSRRLRTYLRPDDADLAATYLPKTAQYVDFYEHWIGAYPYSMFDVVSGQRPLGLGFPGLTYIGAVVLRLPFVPETSLGHEVLHSWWGNAVPVDVSGGNWAEGLTTFMADYTYEERKGEDQARDMRLRWMREYAALPPAREEPLTAFRSRGHTESQVVGYHKAAMVFVMLRDEIGRDAFDRGIRSFWQRNRFRRASWTDLQGAFETSPGGTLEPFFSQWLTRAGSPALELRDAGVREDAGTFAVTFTLAQREPTYRLRVPLIIRDEHGTTAEAVRLDAPTHAYEIRTTQRPHTLCVDPDFRLFRRPRLGEVPPILRSVVFATETSVVIAAHDPQAREAAQRVAAQFLEREARISEPAATLPDGRVALIGTDAEVQAVLARQGIEPPSRIAGRGTARAWAAERAGNGTVVVITGRDAAALSNIAGPLPHYGSESFLVFDGRRAIDRGILPAGPSPLCVDLGAKSAG